MQAQDTAGGQVADPVLERLATANTFEVEWPELQKRLQAAILVTLPVFKTLGPPRSRQSAPSPYGPPTQLTNSDPSTSNSSPSKPSSKPDSERTPSPIGPRNPSSSPIGPATPNADDVPEELRPSTPGGLVIPPFPPLDPHRRKRGSSSASGSGPQVISIAPRTSVNGLGQQTQPIRITSGNVFDDEWDEDIVIGGKKLAGYMEEDEGKKEADRLIKMLDEMDYPPFTIQRLAELLTNPTLRHKSLGKFLRAIEKTLLVQTPYEPPSYTYTPGSGTTYPAPSADSNSTMPPGMGTPKFSPIPFLRRPSPGADDGSTSEAMSPLLLGVQGPGAGEEYRLDEGEVPGGRSPTPEPEDMGTQPQDQDVDMAPSTSTSTTTTPSTNSNGAVHSDPGNQPYLGRVDELDTGPLPGEERMGNGEKGDDERVAPGTGEGGALTPHGMSERPVPISSTTTIQSDERKIAGLPSAAAEGQEKQ